ncbi:site-specific DNA-methyltransferase [Levilactobacillus brevis]|nr:site-specific DNA-methyltransferase [Levilactobacillus brevis]KIO94296.1 Type III restriction-modification system methylation subunit [Levilactobacillus brevis]
MNTSELTNGYRLDFIGKDYARRQVGELPTSVIVPDTIQNNGEGKGSKNLFFTGDNLEVLRHLQSAYSNKVNVVYIDPPYNTGLDDFAYPDKFEYTDDRLRSMFGIDDEHLARLKSIQGKASHSAWLTFMYPRLKLAKNLLTEEGIIFISIDDNEYGDLKIICDGIFGEINFMGNLVWKARVKPSNQGESRIRPQGDSEYVLVYAKNNRKAKFYPLLSKDKKRSYPYDLNGRKYRLATILKSDRGNSSRPTMKFSFHDYTPKSGSRWQAALETIENLWNTGHLEFKNGTPFRRYFEDEEEKLTKPFYNFMETSITGTAESGKKELNKLVGNEHGFDTVKPVELIEHLLRASTDRGDLVLDFFAGSGTTAQAVMQLNAEDHKNRKFIMVQLPEKTYRINKDGEEVPTKGGKTAYNAGYRSIDQISRKRIRCAANKLIESDEVTLPKDFDESFKHFRVVQPTKKTLEDIDDFNPNETSLFTDMINSFSSECLELSGDTSGEETIMTTWLAQDGYSLNEDIKEIKFDNYVAHVVASNRIYIINEGWGTNQTKELLNLLGSHQIGLQSIVVFGYSFNIAELRELENGLKQLDSKVVLIKRY